MADVFEIDPSTVDWAWRRLRRRMQAAASATLTVALAIRAAGLMGYRVLPITTDENHSAASGLAAGRVFVSGKV